MPETEAIPPAELRQQALRDGAVPTKRELAAYAQTLEAGIASANTWAGIYYRLCELLARGPDEIRHKILDCKDLFRLSLPDSVAFLQEFDGIEVDHPEREEFTCGHSCTVPEHGHAGNKPVEAPCAE
jgi:hypothetical protein